MLDAFAIINAVAIVVLVGVTWWYARSTSRLLKQAQEQTTAIQRQAIATQESVELVHLSSLPEWDLTWSTSPQEVRLRLKNNGLGPARNISASIMPLPLPQKALLSPRDPLDQWVVLPGEALQFSLKSDDPPYAGEFVVRSHGCWGLESIARWQILVNREGQHPQMMTLEVRGKSFSPSKQAANVLSP